MSRLKDLLLCLIILVLLAPAIQREFHLFPELKISGYFRPVPEPAPWSVSKAAWLSGDYQSTLSKNLENHIGLRSYFFKIHNQYDFSLFNNIHAEGFVAGKGDQLFEEDYIREYNGDFFIGSVTLNKKLSRLKEVRDHLLKQGTRLAVIIEPGKASILPEFISEKYYRNQKKTTNYEYITERLQVLGIPLLDLNNYFLKIKDTSGYSLFPPYGMHWSIYGMSCVVDTFARFIERETGKDLPSFKKGKIEISRKPRYSDNDIGELLNVFFPLKEKELAYPEMIFGKIKDSLKVLVIADSYYNNLEQFAAPDLFGKDTYWYYNSKVYPYVNELNNPVWVDKSDLANTLGKYDLVLLMSSEINLHCLFWNFPDEAWKAFHPYHMDDPAYLMENNIRNNREWFRFMVLKAEKKFTTLENAISGDARYMAHK